MAACDVNFQWMMIKKSEKNFNGKIVVHLENLLVGIKFYEKFPLENDREKISRN